MLCYVDHHDDAYLWAERRKLETHPKTGAAQLVEIRERVVEIAVPKHVEVTKPLTPKPLLFSRYSEDELLDFGVPEEWLDDVRQANEDTLLEIATHLPGEAAEALLNLAVGGKTIIPIPVPSHTDPFAHPDAQRRFRIMKDVDELARALDYPWEKWTVFLHPAQRQLVEQAYNGPVRISGSAGTGKTIVALHRAVFLAQTHPDARVLLTTFSDTLASALQTKLRHLINHQPRLAERLEVHALDAIGRRLYELNVGKLELATVTILHQLMEEAYRQTAGHKFSLRFLLTEWEDMVDARQLETWEAYRDAKRLGRKTRLSESQRRLLWTIFEQVRQQLQSRNVVTPAAMFTRLALHFAEKHTSPFEFAVVDEAQDINVAQLRFLAVLGADRADSLFFTGDLGQRIFQPAFSWKSLGIDVRGRSRTLQVNYRTSHQIRMQADQLLGAEVSDADGNTVERQGTVSVFNGPLPIIKILDTPAAENEYVASWLACLVTEGMKPHEMGVFVRSKNELERAKNMVRQAGLSGNILDEALDVMPERVAIGTMHLAKGLEFRAVAVMACDDEVIPLQARIENIADDADLEEVYTTERHLLYVACTRARDHLLVTSGGVPSEFIKDLMLSNVKMPSP